MKQVLVSLDDELARRLEEVAPVRSRARSEFIRRAIRQALWDLEEQRTAEAYARQPDLDDGYFDATGWDPWEAPARRRRKR